MKANVEQCQYIGIEDTLLVVYRPSMEKRASEEGMMMK